MRTTAKKFTCGAAALAFGANAVFAEETPFIPPGAVPPEAAEFYKAAIASMNQSKTQAYLSGYETEYLMPLRKHMPSYVYELRALPPAAREAAARACLLAICFNTKSYGDGISALQIRAAALEALRHEGISEEDGVHVAALQNNFKPAQSYLDWEERKIEEAVAELAAGGTGELIAKIGENKESGKHNTAEQYYLWRQLLQMTSDKIRAAFRLPPMRVILDDFPPEMDEAAGFIQGKTLGEATLFVNYNDYTLESPVTAMTVTAHETKHSIDQDFAKMLVDGGIVPPDPRYSPALVFLLNSHTYVMQEMEYFMQYTERTARTFQEKFKDKLFTAFAPQYRPRGPLPLAP